MGKGVITIPDDKLQPLLWDWDGLVEHKGNALTMLHCIMQHKRGNYSVAENREREKKKKLNSPSPTTFH